MDHHVYFWLTEEHQNEADRAKFEQGLTDLLTIKGPASGRWAVPAKVAERPVNLGTNGEVDFGSGPEAAIEVIDEDDALLLVAPSDHHLSNPHGLRAALAAAQTSRAPTMPMMS